MLTPTLSNELFIHHNLRLLSNVQKVDYAPEEVEWSAAVLGETMENLISSESDEEPAALPRLPAAPSGRSVGALHLTPPARPSQRPHQPVRQDIAGFPSSVKVHKATIFGVKRRKLNVNMGAVPRKQQRIMHADEEEEGGEEEDEQEEQEEEGEAGNADAEAIDVSEEKALCCTWPGCSPMQRADQPMQSCWSCTQVQAVHSLCCVYTFDKQHKKAAPAPVEGVVRTSICSVRRSAGADDVLSPWIEELEKAMCYKCAIYFSSVNFTTTFTDTTKPVPESYYFEACCVERKLRPAVLASRKKKQQEEAELLLQQDTVALAAPSVMVSTCPPPPSLPAFHRYVHVRTRMQ